MCVYVRAAFYSRPLFLYIVVVIASLLLLNTIFFCFWDECFAKSVNWIYALTRTLYCMPGDQTHIMYINYIAYRPQIKFQAIGSSFWTFEAWSSTLFSVMMIYFDRLLMSTDWPIFCCQCDRLASKSKWSAFLNQQGTAESYDCLPLLLWFTLFVLRFLSFAYLAHFYVSFYLLYFCITIYKQKCWFI